MKDDELYAEYEEAQAEYEQNQTLDFEERENVPYPILRKIIVSDFTDESLAEIHYHNKKGIAIYVDEFLSWVKNFNRYSSGDGATKWLSIWSKIAITIDRKKGSLRIKKPFVSVCGGIQPRLLPTLANGENADNGFIDRILFAYPEHLQKESWNDSDINPNIKRTYENLIKRFLEEDLKDEPKLLRFNKQAKKLLYEWQRQNTETCNTTTDDRTGERLAKIETYSIRLALLFELIFHACGESHLTEISVRAVQASIEWVHYFTECGERAYEEMQASKLKLLSIDKQKFIEKLPNEQFTTKQAMDLAKEVNIPERTAKRILKSEFFQKIKHGIYQKVA